MSTLVMVRTECCESFKTCGARCSICPNRPENREAVRNSQLKAGTISLGRRLGLPKPAADSARV
jgi:hypothetical protein